MAESNSAEQAENQQKCIDRFIKLANTMKDEGLSPGEVSQLLMSASGLYATYAIAGNSGGLNPSGVDKVADLYKTSLKHIQRIKKDQQS